MQNKITVLMLSIVILSGALARLYRIDLMEFKGDEAHFFMNAIACGQHGIFPIDNLINSAGMQNSPLFSLLLSMIGVFTKNPLIFTISISVFNILGLLLCYRVFRKFSNETTALNITALFAVNPWFVHFSRKIWNPDILLPFLFLFIYFLFNSVFHGKNKQILLAFIVLGITVQLHLSTFFLIPLTGIFLFMKRKKISMMYLLAALAAFCITFIPFFYQMAQNDFKDFMAATAFLGKADNFALHNFIYPFTMLSASGFDFFAGYDLWPLFLKSWSFPKAMFIFFMIVITGFVITSFCIRNKNLLFFRLWIIFGLLSVIIFAKREPRPHFFLAVLPAFMFLAGYGIEFIGKLAGKYKTIVVINAIFLFVFHFSFYIRFVDFIGTQQCFDAGDYGPPYRVLRERVKTTVSAFANKSIFDNIEAIKKASCPCEHCGDKEILAILESENKE